VRMERFVKRSTKALMIGIIAVMALGLVFSGTFAFWGDEKLKGDAGVIFGTVKVSKADFKDHQRRSLGHERYAMLKQYTEQFKFAQNFDFLVSFVMRQVANRSESEALKKTWEQVILLQDAADKGLAVSDEEIQKEKDAFQKFFVPSKEKEKEKGEPDERDPELQAAEFLAIKKDQFDTFFREAVLMDKLLDLVTASEFADYGKVYGELLANEKYARALYAEFNPKDYEQDLDPISPEAILKYYHENNKRFEVQARIMLVYLLADLEEFRKRVPDPSEKEIKDYYDKNKSQFEKVRPRMDEHGHDESEHHPERRRPPQEYRTIEEAREDIVKKLKDNQALELAVVEMRKVGDHINAAAKPYSDTLFDEIKAKFDPQSKPDMGWLKQLTTEPFDQKSIDEVEKTLGKNSRVDWGFGKDRKVGDISPRFKTEKGFVYYRLQLRKEPFVPRLQDYITKTVVKILQKQQTVDRAKKAATNASIDINATWLGSARTKYRCPKHPDRSSSSPGHCGRCSGPLERVSLEFKGTKLFRLDGKDRAGIAEDGALAAEINKNCFSDGNPLPVGQARFFEGKAVVGSKKQEWSFVVVMDDTLEKVPENVETEFKNKLQQENEKVRRDRRTRYVTELVARAELKDFMKDSGGE